MPTEFTDYSLWENIKTRSDEKSFELVFNKYWQKVFITALKHLNDRDRCMELTNDIFVTIWKNRKNLDIRNFNNYLQVAVRYHVYHYIKSSKKSVVDYTAEYEYENTANCAPPADYKLRTEDLDRTLDYYLIQLPKRCREIFILSRKHNLSNTEIASRLSISKRTVENHITDALKHLRLSFKEILSLLMAFLIS